MKIRVITLNGKKFTLGKEYKDTLMKVEGVAVAGISYLTGCDQLQINFVDGTGCVNNHWVHVTHVEKVPRPEKPVKAKQRAGGPAPSLPARTPDRNMP